MGYTMFDDVNLKVVDVKTEAVTFHCDEWLR